MTKMSILGSNFVVFSWKILLFFHFSDSSWGKKVYWLKITLKLTFFYGRGVNFDIWPNLRVSYSVLPYKRALYPKLAENSSKWLLNPSKIFVKHLLIKISLKKVKKWPTGTYKDLTKPPESAKLQQFGRELSRQKFALFSHKIFNLKVRKWNLGDI